MKIAWSLVVSMLAFVPVAVIPRAAAAEETEPSHEHPPLISVRLRASLPLTDLMFMNVSNGVGFGGVWLFGGSAGVEIGSLSLEAGSAFMLTSIDGTQPDSFVRAGYAPTLSEERDEEGHLNVTKLYFAGGYRQLERFASPDGHDGSELTRAVTATAGIEFSHFKTARVAVTYRFLAGFTQPVSRTTSGYWGDNVYFSGMPDLRNAVDLSFQLGLAL